MAESPVTTTSLTAARPLHHKTSSAASPRTVTGVPFPTDHWRPSFATRSNDVPASRDRL